MGLLLMHKRKLRLWNDMFSLSGVEAHDPPKGGVRGEIEVFSKASRYRLFRMLHQLEFSRVTFVTLTYPAPYPEESRKYKAHLKEFRRRFEEKWGKVRAVWRLEFQERGAPHFHIMFLDCPFVDVHDLCWMWKCVVHSWDMAHEIIGVDVKLITDARKEALVASYLSKYIAKVDERKAGHAKRGVGRWWGRWNVVDVEPLEFEITDREAERITSFALRCRVGNQDWTPVDPTICTVFGYSLGSGEFGRLICRYKDFVRGTDGG